MRTLTDRQKLQEIIQELGDAGKLERPTSEVKAMPMQS